MNAKKEAKIEEIASAILQSYKLHGEMNPLEGQILPNRGRVWGVVEDLLKILFPGFIETDEIRPGEILQRTTELVHSIERRLTVETERGFRFMKERVLPDAERGRRAKDAVFKLLGEIPGIRDDLAADIEAAYEGDPAAQFREEIIAAYPGLQAIAVYRLAHVLYREEAPMVPRMMAEYAHSRTGIDIHPGAKIGKRFFIDHGTGVVIGETCTIGDNVKIYQGVTLGARSFERDEKGQIIKKIKRHPDIEDSVTIYSGATILGEVRIGKRSVIGGNVWLTHGIPEDTKIMVRPAQQMHIDRDVTDYQI